MPVGLLEQPVGKDGEATQHPAAVIVVSTGDHEADTAGHYPSSPA
jgi:hypothetical protein